MSYKIKFQFLCHLILLDCDLWFALRRGSLSMNIRYAFDLLLVGLTLNADVFELSLPSI